MRIIRNWDVASYYPHLMTVNGYTSRNIPSPQVFADVLATRMKAKASGDKATANALKLVVNTTYGASLNRYNDLFDPLMGRSVCVSGQLYLLELAQHLYQDIDGLEIVQLNTDGIMVRFDDSQYDAVNAIMKEWQERTGFELEEDSIAKLIQKDVNGYIEVQEDGTTKIKGGYLVRGLAPVGAFNVNNNATIVADAIREFFVNGKPVEETINACNDIMAFQFIAKAGAKYREAYHLVDGEKQTVQKVNRVYASRDVRYGKLFKVKTENDATAKIEMLPDHCVIDNGNTLTIDQVDKQFYIDLAAKRINDFLGIKPEKIKKERKKNTMATTNKTVSIYKRLSIVREKFMEGGIKKTGKNIQLKSMYFQLDDIVPVAMPLFHEQNILPVTNFNREECTLSLIDMDDASIHLDFVAPMREWAGNAAVTPVQALGATITYMRRYLYQMALDVVEVDEMESGATPTSVTSKASTATPTPAHKAPMSEEKREVVKQNLTNPDGAATSLQITQLKKKLKELRTKSNDNDEFVAKIAIETKSFTEISKTRCEEVLMQVSEMLANQE